MPPGTPFEQGDVVLLPFPFSDLSSAKRRPVLVLSKATYNKASPDFVVCAMTSNLGNAAHSVYVEDADMESGRLPKPSRVKVDKVFCASQSLVVKRVGRVSQDVMAQVRRELFAVL